MRSDSSQLEIKGKTGRLTCGGIATVTGGCGKKSRWVPIGSPGAPAHSIAEVLEKEGWSHDGTSWGSMLVGLSCLCPECSEKAKDRRRPNANAVHASSVKSEHMTTPVERINYSLCLLKQAEVDPRAGVQNASTQNAILCLLAAARDLAQTVGCHQTRKQIEHALQTVEEEGSSL